MENITKELLERYFNDRCSESEAAKVLEWFSTEEGQKYLEHRMEEDFISFEKNPLGIQSEKINEIRSEKMWHTITRERSSHSGHNMYFPSRFNLFLRIAAVIALLITASLIYLNERADNVQSRIKMETYQTGNNQQEILNLADGTTVRLNRNSSIRIPVDFRKGNRNLILKGEAYFQVKHDPEHPFVIYAGNAVIRDIGTKFNVKENPGEHIVQVAVVEGKVSIRRRQDSVDHVTYLTKGHFASLYLKTGKIKRDPNDIGNYLSWVNGRISFNATSLSEISVQLHRIFGVDCSFKNKKLRQLKLTADFESHSLKQVLNVISMTLNIKYELNGKHVIWKNS